jgi:cell division protein FtsI (penicillin-binding protein 3)
VRELRHPQAQSSVKRPKNAGGADAAKTRLIVVMLAFTFAFLVIAGRLGQLMIFSHVDEPGLVSGSAKGDVTRADIVDRNGVVLATSLVTQSLYANPKVIIHPESVAKQLVQVFPDLKYKALLTKLTSQQGFIWLKRNLTPKQQNAIYELGLPGIAFQREEKRVYPHGPLLSHVLGCTDVDGQGVSGVEKYFNESLISDPKPLQLSLDVRAQHVLHGEIQTKIDEFAALGGAGLIMDVETSEVVGMCSLPDYNPHNIAKTPPQNMFNTMTLGVYELGSSVKILTTALALESGSVKINSRFDISKPIKIGRFSIKDFHPMNIVADVPTSFLHSSNIAMVRMIQAVGAEKHREYLEKFGLLRASTLELPEVGAPIIPKEWKDISSMTMSYGYGLSVSPLQLANAVSAAVGDGHLRRPTLLKVAANQRDPGVRVVSEKTAHTMRNLLRLTVQHGTGRNANAVGYDVGGKTGTAEKVENGRYNKKNNIVTFISVFPMSKPKYLVMTMVDRPVGNKMSHGYRTAGWVAAPAAKNVVTRMAPMLGIQPIVEEEATSPEYEIFKASAQGGHH